MEKKIIIKSKVSILALLKKYKLNNKKIAIEYNGAILILQIIKKNLRDNDKVEIVHFIGGG